MPKNAKTTSEHVSELYERIESIKRTMSMANGDRAELWAKRQTLQDLYRQIILADIDFTIDKTLEQDLWNMVFKLQISYFQTRIREYSTAHNSNSNKEATTASAAASEKKHEAQANLATFLEAARGFYVKLLEDLIAKYELSEQPHDPTRHTWTCFVPFYNSFPSLFDTMDSPPPPHRKQQQKQQTKASNSNNDANEKQVLYICQHVLTHLGDVARYAGHFSEANNYYLHAIKLVPYLGQPYNQLGILFATSRPNQLAAVFYYIRSIAVRYTFPLAATNLENLFAKLVEIAPPKAPSSALSLKDLLTLYLQINACVYMTRQMRMPSAAKTSSSSSSSSGHLAALVDVFRSAFGAMMKEATRRDQVDSTQLCQVGISHLSIMHMQSCISLD